jgi:hypothetical protein
MASLLSHISVFGYFTIFLFSCPAILSVFPTES